MPETNPPESVTWPLRYEEVLPSLPTDPKVRLLEGASDEFGNFYASGNEISVVEVGNDIDKKRRFVRARAGSNEVRFYGPEEFDLEDLSKPIPSTDTAAVAELAGEPEVGVFSEKQQLEDVTEDAYGDGAVVDELAYEGDEMGSLESDDPDYEPPTFREHVEVKSPDDTKPGKKKRKFFT